MSTAPPNAGPAQVNTRPGWCAAVLELECRRPRLFVGQDRLVAATRACGFCVGIGSDFFPYQVAVRVAGVSRRGRNGDPSLSMPCLGWGCSHVSGARLFLTSCLPLSCAGVLACHNSGEWAQLQRMLDCVGATLEANKHAAQETSGLL